MSPEEYARKRRGKDATGFSSTFRYQSGPHQGIGGYVLRNPGPPNYQGISKGISRGAADVYKQKTGKAYTGSLMAQAKDSTYKSSSFGRADAARAVTAARKARRSASQKTLFGGQVATLFPSQRRDLNRRSSARRQAQKTKKTLGT